jgi:8-oxo-dGTP diphosphatase
MLDANAAASRRRRCFRRSAPPLDISIYMILIAAMPSRASSGARSGLRATINIDIVLLAPARGQLAIFAPQEERARRALPNGAPRAGESLEAAAARIARGALGGSVAWLEQVGTRIEGDVATVLFAGLVAAPDPGDESWIPRERSATLGAAGRRMVDESIAAAGIWLDRTPVAFTLLPGSFTLSELQEVYEAILGRTLHKASFRRALQSARLVTPTREWRSEGRGRPAQLYRFVRRAPKASRRGVRFDWLTS